MGKARHNGKDTYVNLETLCLDCGKIGFVTSTINNKGYYETYNEDCFICKRNTMHIKCKNLDELKSKLEFCDKNNRINKMIIDIMNNKGEKQKIKIRS